MMWSMQELAAMNTIADLFMVEPDADDDGNELPTFVGNGRQGSFAYHYGDFSARGPQKPRAKK